MRKEEVAKHTHEAIIPALHADLQDATKSECLLMVNIMKTLITSCIVFMKRER